MGAGGRAAWVLAGGALAAALAMGVRSQLPARTSSSPHPLRTQRSQDLPTDTWAAPSPGTPSGLGSVGPEPSTEFRAVSREVQDSSENGVIFQKCAMVSGQSEPQMVHVQLWVNNSRTASSANLSDLFLVDEVLGLTVRESAGNRTLDGLQTFRKKFLPVGECYFVSYSASLDPTALGTGDSLNLSARLTFQSPSQNRTQLEAPFTITVEEKIMVLPHHGLHAAGFIAAFLISLLLSWVALFFLARCWCLQGSVLATCLIQETESKLEPSPFASSDAVSEELSLSDQMIDILMSEDPGSMLQALEELEIATLTRADVDLEACRNQISKDIIAILMKNLTSDGHLSPQAERKMTAAFKKQFLLLENEIQEENDRKLVALTAEFDLEMRKKTENQYQREMVAMEEAEELLKHVSERATAECSSLLRTLHGLEQEDIQRSLTLHQEEEFAQAHRQLAIFQRNELRSIFFSQIQSAVVKGELNPEAAKVLLQHYSKTQESVEELMDFLQATKRYHLSKRFGHREYLVHSLQATETRVQGLLSTAAAQLTSLIHKHERAGYLDEDQMEMLLERAQTEVFSIKQKLDNDLRQEKKKLHQKLITKRRQELLQKYKEQQKEQLALGEASSTADDTGQYLQRWRSVVTEHSATLEELQERLDQAVLDDLQALTVSLSEKAMEELRRLQSSAMTQELLKRSAPWLFLHQILEEHSQESAARAEQLEAEEREQSHEHVQDVRQRLQQDAPEACTEEQAELRRWEHLVFTTLCCVAMSLSEEELLRLRQEAQSCFAQMDRSLAPPRVRARVLLQQFQTALREAEFQKLDQALSVLELQPRGRKLRGKGKGRSKADLLRKNLEEKIRLFEEQPPKDLADKVRGELLQERVQWLEAQEVHFAESVVALQFQKVAQASETLSAYASLFSIQDLLLRELSESETLAKSACIQILESHEPELQELERKLEEQLVHQEEVEQQQVLERWRHWVDDEPELLNEAEEGEAERQVSTVLRQALSKGQRLLEYQQQRVREQWQSAVRIEDLLESLEADTLANLCSQGLRLVSYLMKMTVVPLTTLRRVLSVVLPSASRPQLLPLLNSISEKHSNHIAENESIGDQAELGRRRKHQGWWKALDSKLREDLANEGVERMLWAHRRKESILKKTQIPVQERVMFPGKGSWPHLLEEPIGQLVPMPITGAETIDMLNTSEKIFIFRSPQEPDISSHVPPRRKKNFLNSKKASRVLSMD